MTNLSQIVWIAFFYAIFVVEVVKELIKRSGMESWYSIIQLRKKEYLVFEDNATWKKESKSQLSKKQKPSPDEPTKTYEDLLFVNNANQQKSYNAKYEFFTKPLGPGHYKPLDTITKPDR